MQIHVQLLQTMTRESSLTCYYRSWTNYMALNKEFGCIWGNSQMEGFLGLQ